MFGVVDRLRHDPTLAEVAASDHRVPSAGSAASAPALLVVTRGLGGEPLLLVARGDRAGAAALLLVATSTGGVFPAAVLGSVMRAAGEPTLVSEFEPDSLPADVLARWERPAAAGGMRGVASRNGESDGRWLWGLALLLLVVEWWLRRATRPTVVPGRAE
jgi:hypothetical protein